MSALSDNLIDQAFYLPPIHFKQFFEALAYVVWKLLTIHCMTCHTNKQSKLWQGLPRSKAGCTLMLSRSNHQKLTHLMLNSDCLNVTRRNKLSHTWVFYALLHLIIKEPPL